MSGNTKAGLLTMGAMLALAVGCGGSQAQRPARTRASGIARSTAVDDNGRCDTEGADREVSEYDTSGDQRPDVRRVFRRVGDAATARLVLACRESDLNADGTKDVVRYYNDEGRPLREEADRNFDGHMDTVTYFQDGRIVRVESDENGDGQIDSKVFFDDDGSPSRTERDTAGRSTATNWHPDRWEYFEQGRIVRLGIDIDGDGRVDRWDRDREHAPAPGEDQSSSAPGADAAS